jgi:hypothetical protein
LTWLIVSRPGDEVGSMLEGDLVAVKPAAIEGRRHGLLLSVHDTQNGKLFHLVLSGEDLDKVEAALEDVVRRLDAGEAVP